MSPTPPAASFRRLRQGRLGQGRLRPGRPHPDRVRIGRVHVGRVRPGRVRRVLGVAGWAAVCAVGLTAILLAQTWVWWQQEPSSGGTRDNAIWARHQWVGQTHTDAEYRALAGLLRDNRITDVFFHAGPFDPDGGVPPAKYANAGRLIAAMREYAPGVRLQAYLGQIRKVEGDHGLLRLEDPAVRAEILRTDAAMLDAGFDGIHYDIEPIYPDDDAFVALLDQTRRLTTERRRILSVSLEQPTLFDAAQPVYRALLPRRDGRPYPPRPTAEFLRTVAGRVDQVAIMTYDVSLPTRSLVGRHFAWHTERTLRLIGDRVTVFMGVPTYRPSMPWAEDLPEALRGVRRGVDALDRPPARPYGVGIYAEWTTSPAEWRRYQDGWPSSMSTG